MFPRHGPLLASALLVQSGWRRDVAAVGQNVLLVFPTQPTTVLLCSADTKLAHRLLPGIE
jgi:hypothetical protein